MLPTGIFPVGEVVLGHSTYRLAIVSTLAVTVSNNPRTKSGLRL